MFLTLGYVIMKDLFIVLVYQLDINILQGEILQKSQFLWHRQVLQVDINRDYCERLSNTYNFKSVILY